VDTAAAVETAEADCPERLNFDLRIPDLEQAALLADGIVAAAAGSD
jgi:hypothetical protein